MSTATVQTVKCVDIVPGSSRYCSSVAIPFGKSDIGTSILATVVVPYEEMGVFYDRIVRVNSVTYTVAANVSSGVSAVGDVTMGTFNSSQTVSERVGRYALPFDQGHVELNGPFGAVVVHEGDVFGVRATLTKLSTGDPETFNGSLVINIDFSLVGHSL